MLTDKLSMATALLHSLQSLGDPEHRGPTITSCPISMIIRCTRRCCKDSRRSLPTLPAQALVPNGFPLRQHHFLH
jgi:hypothetical protein